MVSHLKCQGSTPNTSRAWMETVDSTAKQLGFILCMGRQENSQFSNRLDTLINKENKKSILLSHNLNMASPIGVFFFFLPLYKIGSVVKEWHSPCEDHGPCEYCEIVAPCHLAISSFTCIGVIWWPY